jgi:putative ubiquitin-RnfH superfamily antitoxin RatB of RatAB toxin-antitoxin module
MSVSEISIEVAYAPPGRQILRRLSLPDGSSAADAIRASGLPAEFPEIDLARNRIGIYGKLVRPETKLHDRDRIEIYRPLQADPKEVRRARAARTRARRRRLVAG